MKEISGTFLFDKIIFGPVKSRRLGVSLGINLLPVDSKLCNMNCIYCECGWTGTKALTSLRFRSLTEVMGALREKLAALKEAQIRPDSITFAGNGEPTMHPGFPEIVEETIRLRDEFFPQSKIAVLTNAMLLHKQNVVQALMQVDLRLLKLDAGTDELFGLINQPHSNRSLDWIVRHLKQFDGDLQIQSMFLKGMHNEVEIDNSEENNVVAWLELLKEIKPRQVMLYTLDRATPEKNLEKISQVKLESIAHRVRGQGIPALVS